MPSRALRDYVDLQRGNTYKGTLLGLPGPKLLGLGSIQRNGGFKGGSLKSYGGESDARILLRPGDVYVSLKDVTQSADLLGAVARVPHEVEQGRLTQDTVKLEFKDGAPISLIYWVLRSPEYRGFCRSFATGTTNLGLPREDFLAYLIPDPTPARLQMVAVLDALEDKIEVNRRMNETLEAMARAIFKDWFVDFGPTRAKMEGRAPYLAPDIWSLFPDRLDDEGKPEGWVVTQLDKLLSVLETGGRPKGGVSSYRYGVPSVGAESITRLGEFDFGKTKYVPEEFFNSMKKGHVQSRDVLLYKDGGKPGLFEPHVTLFGDDFPFPRFAINEHVYRIRVQEDFGQNCLYFWLSTEAAKAEMRIKGTGVAIPGLNSTQVRSLSVIIPSDGLAKRLDRILEPFVTRVLANCNEARTLATTRDFLLPKLMSGEVRVKDAEAMAEEVL
ncbi:hypothetical protein PbB2_02946 [Candidatus Phycosocius bacilliformis]|uniref:Type I restriction modification DNA specificity domain-containing protein n=1 Tax=Candidatus Phycosocius bacilliformis TaxID=1445552 RepID=A0A2P2EDW0_9PROT|nr:restriction endonuclease subunit S [Candidatus Phycosocius bacilliformis]GBF59254.1 hypothetical protein PbB2_02946 [Candidatus Phycosocius bacilliformis]